MGLPLAPYFLCLYYFGPAVAHSCFSTYCQWIGFLSLSGPIQTRLLLQDPLYEPVSHSFLPLRLNGFFLLTNFGLPMLMGLFSYWALSKLSLNNGQLRVVHLILDYEPLLRAFQDVGQAIRAGNLRIHRIDVSRPGFLAWEDLPPVELPLQCSPREVAVGKIDVRSGKKWIYFIRKW